MHAQQILFLLAAAGAAFVEARPSSLAPRQASGGSFECNAARVRIVAGLGETRSNVDRIDDVTTRGTAVEGINLASNAINSIAVALLSGEGPPAGARQTVAGGLNTTQAALDAGNKQDPAVVSASASFEKTVAAASDVVEFCT